MVGEIVGKEVTKDIRQKLNHRELRRWCQGHVTKSGRSVKISKGLKEARRVERKRSRQREQHVQRPCGRGAWCLGGAERRTLPPASPPLGHLLSCMVPSLFLRSLSTLQRQAQMPPLQEAFHGVPFSHSVGGNEPSCL